MDPVLSELRRAALVPVIKIDRPQDAVPLAEARVGAGLPVREITFPTKAAARAAIQRITIEVPAVVLGGGYHADPRASATGGRCGRPLLATAALKHTIPGDLNSAAGAEVHSLAGGNTAGRVPAVK
jgi:2-keto-3-deoxy-6-phosphogluconate aldolase